MIMTLVGDLIMSVLILTYIKSIKTFFKNIKKNITIHFCIIGDLNMSSAGDVDLEKKFFTTIMKMKVKLIVT